MTWSREEIDAMDLRLKNWGRWCRAGGGDPVLWESDKACGAGLTCDQVWDAWSVQLMVMRLPLDMRVVVQVHYVSRPVEAANGQGESRVDEANRRLRAAGEHRRLNADGYRYTRERAVTNMLNGSKGLTGADRGVSSRSNWLGLRTSVASGLKIKGSVA